MCRTFAAPMAAAVTMAGTTAGIALALLRDRMDRRKIDEEARNDVESSAAASRDDEKKSD